MRSSRSYGIGASDLHLSQERDRRLCPRDRLQYKPQTIQYETPETVALRLKSRRSYLLRLDAPIVSNSDVADALRASVARVPTVELVLERDLSDKDQSLLTAQRKRLEATPILYEDTLPPKEVAQAIRSTDVDKLATLPDAVLETFIPQLTQALKRGQPCDLLTKFYWRER